jgi:hypothetical protein
MQWPQEKPLPLPGIKHQSSSLYPSDYLNSIIWLLGTYTGSNRIQNRVTIVVKFEHASREATTVLTVRSNERYIATLGTTGE